MPCPWLLAQPALPKLPANTPATFDADSAARTEALGRAKLLARGGDVTAVDAAVSKLNHSKPQTSGWHAETAAQLVALAEDFAREGRAEITGGLAARAVDHLRQAASLAKNARLKARALHEAGSAYENLLGNVPAAIESYRAALAEEPGNKRLQEALTHAELMDANLRARIAIAQKKAATAKPNSP